MRSIYCGQVNEAHAGQTITLCGWVHRRRDLGGLIFIDMRDREGIVQVFFDPDKPDAFALASELRGEFCIQVTGVVRTRPDSQRNSDMATGAIEVFAHELTIINRAEPLPLDFNQVNSEEISLKYRYLDLRRPESQVPEDPCQGQRLRTPLHGRARLPRYRDPDADQGHPGRCP